MTEYTTFENFVADLSNVPDISGAWETASRKTSARNPGDGIKDINPPDPKAEGGKMVIKIEQNGRTYTSQDVINANHDHTTEGFYIGNNTFAFTMTRTADGAPWAGYSVKQRVRAGLLGASFNERTMTLHGTATLVDKDTLRVAIVGAQGGNAADRDPPADYAEERIYKRKQQGPQQ